MKKILPLIIVLAAVVAGALVYFRNKPEAAPGMARAAELAPADTIVFLAAPDVARSLERWKGTAIYKISQEPEWQAFAAKLDQYLFSLLPEKGLGEGVQLLQEADPSAFFVAISDPEAANPRFTGGVAYRGKQTLVKSAIEKWQKFLLSGVAAPKSEIVKHEGTDIEQLSSSGRTFAAFAYRDNWFLFASDVEQMKSLLQRYAAKDAAGTLAKAPVYAECLKQATPEADFIGFVNTGAMFQKSREKWKTPPSPWDAYQPEAVLFSLKLESPWIRHRSYVRMPKMPKALPMANRLAAFTSSETYAYGSLNVAGLEELVRLILAEEEKNDSSFEKDLAMKGLKPMDLMSIFGPELSVHSDWEPVAVWPNVIGVVEVRDAAKARNFAALLAEKIGSSGTLSTKEEDGVTYWTAAVGAVVTQPTVAVSDKHMAIAINYATAVAAFKQLKSGGSGSLSQSAEFQQALKAVPAPTAGTAYIDTKKLFERLYEKLKPMAAMQLASNPQTAQWLDPAKFPKAETISKHLGPTAVVYADAPAGFILESHGPVPFEGFLVAGASWYAFLEMGPPRPAPTPPAAPAPATRGGTTTTPAAPR